MYASMVLTVCRCRKYLSMLVGNVLFNRTTKTTENQLFYCDVIAVSINIILMCVLLQVIWRCGSADCYSG